MKGNLFIVASPSGGGKGTLIREVLKTVPNVGYSISFTTRAARGVEVNGREYFFVTPEEFLKKREAGELLEWAQVHGNFYGTSRTQVETETAAGRDIILEIDVQGAAIVKQKMSGAVGIFIMPPSFEILSQRLENRQTESESNRAVRLLNARTEVERYSEFDYVIVNDEIARAAEQLAAVFLAERARRERMETAVKEIIKTFRLNN